MYRLRGFRGPGRVALINLINTFKLKDIAYLHVVNENQELTGIISFRDIRPLLGEEEAHYLIIAKDVATEEVATVSPEDNIQHALHIMNERGISQIPVVTVENGKKVIATLREKDVITAYDNAIIRHEIERG